MSVELGINGAFAVKRWPEPEAWLEHVAEDLGLRLVQVSCDQIDPRMRGRVRSTVARGLRDAAARRGVRIHSVFAGLAAYSGNLLLHPDPRVRGDGVEWCEEAIALAAEVGARAFGGPLGAMSVRDAANPARREYLAQWEMEAIWHLTEAARDAGLDCLLWEPTPLAREIPSSIAGTRVFLERANAHAAVPVRLCLDVGHACRAGASGDDADPYAWIRELGAHADVLHLQQTDGRLDRHWPFTRDTARHGVISGDRVADAVRRTGRDIALVLEIFHPFEAADEVVLADLVESVSYWKPHIAALGG